MQKKQIDYEEVLAPVARLKTIGTVLATAVEKKLLILNLHQMNVVTACLQGNLEEEIYKKQPDLFHKHNRKIGKLKKLLYAPQKAGRGCYKKLDNTLKNLGLKKSEKIHTNNNKLASSYKV